jgi:hypothetical protein
VTRPATELHPQKATSRRCERPVTGVNML